MMEHLIPEVTALRNKQVIKEYIKAMRSVGNGKKMVESINKLEMTYTWSTKTEC